MTTAAGPLRHLLRVLPVAALALLWAGGCGPPTELRPLLDLVQSFGSADVSVESDLIDFGIPGGAGHQVVGWSWNEKSKDGTTFVWSNGEESTLEFFVADVRDLEVGLRCLAYPFEDGEAQTMTVAINGHEIADLGVSGAWQEAQLTVPADSLVPGANTMTFRYGRLAEVGPKTGVRRVLGVAFDRIEFNGLAGAEPRTLEERELLILGEASRVEYFFEAPAGAVLSVDEIIFDGADEARLTIELERDGAPGDTVAEIRTSTGPRQWPLGRQGGIYRLSIGASVGKVDVDDVSVSLSRPRVLAPVSAESEETALEPQRMSRPGADTGRPNVILYVVDTLRADHLSVYGYDEALSPELEHFAAESVTFDAAVAQAPWTLPAMASVFTGLGPRTHNANSRESRLPPEVETLAERMSAAGYATGAVVSNGFVSQTFGFDQGFDHFKLLPFLETTAGQVSAEASQWLDAVGDEQPIFLFLHSIDPHDAYDPPGDFRPEITVGAGEEALGTSDGMKVLKESGATPGPELLARVVSLYDGEVAYTDWAFGQFMQELRQRGLYDSSLIIFMSDHGEEFFDHGSWLHGHTLHSELLDVPLMVRFPAADHAGTRVEVPVQQIDLIPTLLEYLELGEATGLEGHSLLAHLGAGDGSAGTAGKRPVISYLENRWMSIVRGDWKLISRPRGDKGRRWALYNRTDDPRETRNAISERPVLAGFLGFSMAEHFRTQQQVIASAKADIDEDMEERLRALGYLD